MEEMSVDLRLDQDEVDEEHDEVMLHVLIAESSAFSTDRETNVVPTRLITGSRVGRP